MAGSKVNKVLVFPLEFFRVFKYELVDIGVLFWNDAKMGGTVFGWKFGRAK